MKTLLWKLIFPLTIIAFSVCSKSWHVALDNNLEATLTGFPFPYCAPGWHTSLSLQVFFYPLLADLLTYFVIITALVTAFHYLIKPIQLKYKLTRSLLGATLLLLIIWTMLLSNSDNVFTASCPFECEVWDTEVKWVWDGMF